ncbi:MAG: MMPL family transporter [Gammaproteobacteria bacterium]
MSVRIAALIKPLIWIVTLTLLCVSAGLRLDVHQPVDTNLLDLLPASQQSPLLGAATQRTQTAFLRDVLLVVSAADYAQAQHGAEAAQTALTTAGLPVSDPAQSAQSLLNLYREHPYALLTTADQQRLDKNPVSTFTNDVAAAFANPAGMVGVLGTDPGGYLGRFLMRLPQPYPNFTPDGPFMSAQRNGRSYFLLRATLTEAAFGEQGANHAVAAVSAARAAVKARCPECTVLATGAALFSAAAQREARQEVFWLTTASILFIVLLILVVFRSLRPLILGVLSVAAGVLSGAAAVVICFGSIHILTLVCGTTLLGIAIDYAFLYFAEYLFGDGPVERTLKTVLPGLSMGLVTGVIAFAFLLLAGFPALTQIAIFSVVGLIASYATVLLLFPPVLRRRPALHFAKYLHWPQRLLKLSCRRSRWRYLVPLILVLLSIPGWVQLRTSDDVRELQNFPKPLLAADENVRNLLGQTPPPGFFLIEGATIQQVLQREEALFMVTAKQFPDAMALGLSRFLPSEAQQQANLNSWAKVYRDPATLKQAFEHTGLPTGYVDTMEKNWKNNPRTTLTADALLTAEPELGQFVLRAGGQTALIATVMTPIGTVAQLQAAAARVTGTSFVAPLQRITGTFRQIRWRATWLVVAGYVLISLLLIWRYGRRDAVHMLYPPLLALAVTLGVLGWLHEPVNIFVLVGLILVLGVGRDYTVFLREGARSRATALGVTLAALTTLCSFGMLIFSAIPALHAFGLATLIGILVSYLSAPLSIAPDIKDTASA